MPIYEYECQSCGEELERFEHYVDAKQSPRCKCGNKMKKIPSAGFCQFYGVGAFATDYGPQWRNQWGSKFYRNNAGKEPRDQQSGHLNKRRLEEQLG